MKKHIIKLLFALCITTSFVLSAQDIKDSSDDRLIELRAKAKAGDIKAQLQLANEYYSQKKDHTLAALWYRRAAKGGNAEAAYMLGQCYDNGDGVDQSLFHAFKFYQQAAEKKHQHARYEIALKYANGIPENKIEHTPELSISIEKAMKLLNDLAEEGYAPAMREIAQLYLKQKNRTTEDTKIAYKHLLNAVKAQDPASMRILADCLYNGIGCKKDLVKMIYYLKQAAKRNDLRAQGKLAFCYENGLGVKPDFKVAFQLHKSAASKGFSMSQVKMGDYCILGEFAEQSLKNAILWYKKAAKQNHPLALYKLGSFALQGIGMKEDEQLAFNYMLRSASLGYAKAQLNTAFLYKEGRGIQKDENKAFFWFEKASKLNDNAAQLELAFCYMNGIGTKKNQKKGLELLNKAAKSGNREARQILTNMVK